MSDLPKKEMADRYRYSRRQRVDGVVVHPGHAVLSSAAGKLMLTMLRLLRRWSATCWLNARSRGMARAKAEGKVLGRPTKTTDEQRCQIAADHLAGVSISELARRFAISRASVLSIVKPAA